MIELTVSFVSIVNMLCSRVSQQCGRLFTRLLTAGDRQPLGRLVVLCSTCLRLSAIKWQLGSAAWSRQPLNILIRKFRTASWADRKSNYQVIMHLIWRIGAPDWCALSTSGQNLNTTAQPREQQINTSISHRRICKKQNFSLNNFGRQGGLDFNFKRCQLSGCPKTVGKQTGRQTHTCTHTWPRICHAHHSLCCAVCVLQLKVCRRLLQMSRPQSGYQRGQVQRLHKLHSVA